MPFKSKIRWGIIGCGDVTEVKSGPGFQKARGSELVAVMRRDAAKAEGYAKRHNVPRWYSDADRLIEDPQVDAVYIATPPGSHEFYAHKVCAAGKPCYVEKPMARNAAEAQRMVDAFAAAKLPLFVAYYRRALPRFLMVKQIVDSGVLGRLSSVSYIYADDQMTRKTNPVPWRLEAEHAGAGLFLDLGSHALDLLDYVLGPATNVSGRAFSQANAYDVEDNVELKFSVGDVPVTATWNFAAPARKDEYDIHGASATLTFACFANDPIRVTHHDRRVASFEIPHPPHVAQPLIQSVVNELLMVEGEPWAYSFGSWAIRTQRVMDQALESYYGGREDGFWTRPWPGTPSAKSS